MMIGVLKYWKLGVLLILLGVWLFDRAAQYRQGVADEQARQMAIRHENMLKNIELAQKISKEYQENKAAREAVERVRDVEVEKIVAGGGYDGACFDDDGVSVVNAAIED